MSTTLIIGTGAVGCSLASILQRHGEDIVMMSRPSQTHALQAIQSLRLDDNTCDVVHETVAPRIVGSLPNGLERVIIATKNEALSAVINALQTLPEDVPVITTLNGVSHLRRLREAFPRHCVNAATVMYNTQRLGPLHVNINTSAVIHMPESDSATLFAAAGIKVLPWSEARFNGKLVLNVVNALGALTNKALNTALAEPQLADCFLAAIVEAGNCLLAAEQPFEMVGATSFSDYQHALDNPNSRKLGILPPSGGRSLALKASMIADIENGNETEVREINGEIVRIGKQIGFFTPINSKLVELIEQREAKQIGVLSTDRLRTLLGIDPSKATDCRALSNHHFAKAGKC